MCSRDDLGLLGDGRIRERIQGSVHVRQSPVPAGWSPVPDLTCLYLLGARIKGVCHEAGLKLYKLFFVALLIGKARGAWEEVPS